MLTGDFVSLLCVPNHCQAERGYQSALNLKSAGNFDFQNWIQINVYSGS